MIVVFTYHGLGRRYHRRGNQTEEAGNLDLHRSAGWSVSNLTVDRVTRVRNFTGGKIVTTTRTTRIKRLE